jgi:signal transduction histidine kinase
MANSRERRQSLVLALVFGLLVVSVLTVEFLSYRKYEKDLSRAAGTQLVAITAEKALAAGNYQAGLSPQTPILATDKNLPALVGAWPLPSSTAAVMLARLEGDQVALFTANAVKGELAPSTVPPGQGPAFRRILDGETGVVESAGRLMAGQAFGTSSWYLVTSISRSEALAPLQNMRWLIIIFTGVLLVCVVATMFGAILDIAEIKNKDAALQQKSAEMERFTYSVSHDLKSPLVTIRTFAGYLTQDAAGDPTQLKKDIEYIQDAAQRMHLLLDELLHMSRVGRVSTVQSDIPFNRLAQEAAGAVAGRLSARAARLDIKEDPIVLRGDHSRLEEVWQNLVENAVKYMGEQTEPQITIGVDRRARETVFYVQDNGMGIEEEHQARIFDLFEKLDDSTEGTGFGLALVKRIVELYQGRIWVESAGLGKGSTFRFTLPDALSHR